MKESIKIIFFDSTWSQLLRFGSAISALIKEKHSDVKTIGLLCERMSEEDKKQKHSFDAVYAAKDNLKMANYVTEQKPDILVIVKHTVRDQNVVLRAKKAGAMIFELQHGMLYEGASLNNFNPHEVFAAALNLGKTLVYLNTLRQMCKYDGRSYAELLKKIMTERKDVAHIVENHFSVKLNGDYAMVIGEHWIDYFCENYDYERDRVLLMGNHDVDNMVLGKSLEDAICYIPSVHVEDGKVRASVFKKFVDALSESIDVNTKFYIKMHPRGDMELYREAFVKHNVTYITGSELPYVTTYIGHNSTLIAKALMLTNKVILWGFKEETELFYKPWAYAFCDKPEELKDAIQKAVADRSHDEAALNEMRKISYINPEGAFQFAARNIMALYSDRERN